MKSEGNAPCPPPTTSLGMAGAREEQAAATRAPRPDPAVTWPAAAGGHEPLVDFWVGDSPRAATPSTLARLPLAAPLCERLARGEPGRLACDVALFDHAIRLVRQGGRLPCGPLLEVQALEAAGAAEGCFELARELRLQPHRQACEDKPTALLLCGLALALSAEGCEVEAEDAMAQARERLQAGLDLSLTHYDVGLSLGASERAAAAHLEARWALQHHANTVYMVPEDRWTVAKKLAPMDLDSAALAAYIDLWLQLPEVPVEVLLLVAEVAWESNSAREALPVLQEAAERAPQDSCTHARLAEVLCRLHRVAEAAAATGQAMSVAVTARSCAIAARLAAMGQPIDGHDRSPPPSWQVWVARGRALAAGDVQTLFELADVAQEQEGGFDRQAFFAAARLPRARWHHRLVAADMLHAYGCRQHETDRAEAVGWLRQDLEATALGTVRKTKILEALAGHLAHEGRLPDAVALMHEGARMSFALGGAPAPSARIFLGTAALLSKHEQWPLALIESTCAMSDSTCCSESLVLGLQAALRLQDYEALRALAARAEETWRALLKDKSRPRAREAELSIELDVWRAYAEVKMAVMERSRVPHLHRKFAGDRAGSMGRFFHLMLRFIFLRQTFNEQSVAQLDSCGNLFFHPATPLGAQGPMGIYLIECMVRRNQPNEAWNILGQLIDKDPQATVGHCGRSLSAFLVDAAVRLSRFDMPQMVTSLVNRALEDPMLPEPTRRRAASVVEAQDNLARAEPPAV